MLWVGRFPIPHGDKRNAHDHLAGAPRAEPFHLLKLSLGQTGLWSIARLGEGNKRSPMAFPFPNKACSLTIPNIIFF